MLNGLHLHFGSSPLKQLFVLSSGSSGATGAYMGSISTYSSSCTQLLVSMKPSDFDAVSLALTTDEWEEHSSDDSLEDGGDRGISAIVTCL